MEIDDTETRFRRLRPIVQQAIDWKINKVNLHLINSRAEASIKPLQHMRKSMMALPEEQLLASLKPM